MRPTSVYDNFLRCLSLYAKELISAQDLLGITEPFLNKQPDLYIWMKNFLGLGDSIDEDTPLPDLGIASWPFVVICFYCFFTSFLLL